MTYLLSNQAASFFAPYILYKTIFAAIVKWPVWAAFFFALKTCDVPDAITGVLAAKMTFVSVVRSLAHFFLPFLLNMSGSNNASQPSNAKTSTPMIGR
jgi:ribose/xylose/arabinose/galactoside ABC-type transport system permease subunit